MGTNALDQGRALSNKGVRLGTDNDNSIAKGVKIRNNPELGGSATMFEGISFDGVAIGGNEFLVTVASGAGRITELTFWNRGNTRTGSFGSRANIQWEGGNSWSVVTGHVRIDDYTGVLGPDLDESSVPGSAPAAYAPVFKLPNTTFVGPNTMLDGNWTFEQTIPGNGSGIKCEAGGVAFAWRMPPGFNPLWEVGGGVNFLVRQSADADGGTTFNPTGLQLNSNYWDGAANQTAALVLQPTFTSTSPLHAYLPFFWANAIAWSADETGRFWLGTPTTGTGTPILFGGGDPNGAHAAPQGAIFLRNDGGSTTTLYVKESGGTTLPGTNTGWVGK